MFSIYVFFFFFKGYGAHRDLTVRTHSFPTRRSSDLDDRSATALSGAARRLANAGDMDAVLIADVGGNAIRAVPVIRSTGDKQTLGTELWNTTASPGGHAAMRGAWFASVYDGLYGQLSTKYRSRYGTRPSRVACLGHDSMLLPVIT